MAIQYDYPELSDPNWVFQINEAARRDMLFFIRRRLHLIVFYGNIGSAINRRDIGSLRYVCGTKQYVMGKLSEMEFKTWMDYRSYVFIVNQDYTFGRISGRFEFDIEDLLRMASYVRTRKRVILARKSVKIALDRYMDKSAIDKRRDERRRIDRIVLKSLEGYKC